MSENYLETIRIKDGNEKLKAEFQAVYKRNSKEAINYINDRVLTFPSLYILMPIIESLNIYKLLIPKNQIAIGIVNQITKPNANYDYLQANDNAVHNSLRWMLETGIPLDTSSNEYEKILDVTVSVLINVYRDKNILPVVSDMIFKRNRIGHYINDLVWAYFRLGDPASLELVAKHITSNDNNDTELSCNLLNIRQPNENKEMLYKQYEEWLKENDPFLYFTNESYQISSNPAFAKVDLERKYLDKGTNSYDKQPIKLLSNEENKQLKAFEPLSEEVKAVLSEYSWKIKKKDKSEWKKWMNNPISVQINEANANSEDSK